MGRRRACSRVAVHVVLAPQPLPSRAGSLCLRFGREGVKSASSARQSASDGVAAKTPPGKKSAGSELFTLFEVLHSPSPK